MSIDFKTLVLRAVDTDQRYLSISITFENIITDC